MRSIRVIGLLLLAFFVFDAAAIAQISMGGQPISFQKTLSPNIETAKTPPVDFQRLLAEEEAEKDEAIPFRFGEPFDVYYTLSNSGNWETLQNGDRVWRLRIESPGAYSINLLYSHFYLPEGAEFFIYSEENDMVLGAFTSRNNKPWPEFATAPIKGESCVLEYYEPAPVAGQGIIDISRIVHGYKDVFFSAVKDAEKAFGSSGSCNNNVNCPEGADWQDQKRAVAMILTSGGFRICSGSMVNNAREDGTPYFLTANHCLGGESTWIFMFNYESPNCSNIDGPTSYTVSGSTLLANWSTSDFALLRLSSTPPPEYNIFYNGWSAEDVASTSSTAIHHPAGDIKKISFDYDAATSANYLSTSGTTHWRIGNWEDGTTEGGSSGSPLYDQNQRVVGQLHGGYASCTSITADWYGKFSLSWTGGGAPPTRLRDWLDPDDLGVTVLDGFDPNIAVSIDHSPLDDTQDFTNDYEIVAEVTAPETLVADSILLHYAIASVWTEVTMYPTGAPDTFSAFIPAQVPGTIIEYFISARDISDNYDETEIFTFKVIDYEMALTPDSLQGAAVVGDSVYFDLTVTNGGVYDDEYTFNINGSTWPITLYDETGQYVVSSSGILSSDASMDFIAAVEVPSSIYNEFDEFQVEAVSLNQGGLSKSSTLRALSLGTLGVYPWFDDFAGPDLSNVQWVFNDGAVLSTNGINPPSEPYSLNLDGGDDVVRSQVIDLSLSTGAILSYFYQQGGDGLDPGLNENLSVEYYNNQGEWTVINVHEGAEPAMTAFENVNIPLPPDALHRNFQVQFISLGSVEGYDDWFVDDVRIDYAPDLAVTSDLLSQTLGPDDSYVGEITITNDGLGPLVYDIRVYPDLDKLSLFGELVASGDVMPATRDYPEVALDYTDVKGIDDGGDGFAVDKDAGGPDLFGNYWIDSDQPGGPDFDWIDISSTGEDITYLFDDDNHTGYLEIGFSFPFYGSTYDSICIGSNGMIGFDTTSMHNRSNVNIPSLNEPDKMLAWFWDDLDPTNGSNPGAKVYFDTTGGRAIVQFVDYPEYSAAVGDVMTAEVILLPDGTIKYQYLTIAEGHDKVGCTVGIENNDGSDGLEVVYNSDYLHDSLAVVFYQPTAWMTMSKSGGTVLPAEADTLEITFSSSGLDTGEYKNNIVIFNNDPDPLVNPYELTAELTVIETNPYTCGDLDGNDMVDILDIIMFIDYKFKGGPDPESLWAADVNADGAVDILDITYMIDFKFKGGPEPACL